ncbi:hypothetical protein pb186bvf_000553 [Paramecium bursaria]
MQQYIWAKGFQKKKASENIYQIKFREKPISPVKFKFKGAKTLESDDSPIPFKMIDITKLPTGNFQDRSNK